MIRRRLLLIAVLGVIVVLPTTARATSVAFDSDAAAWFAAAAHWPGAGPIFDASDLVIAVYHTFVVNPIESTVETAEIDAAFAFQTVCRGDAPYCTDPYPRPCCHGFPSQEANSELFHMILREPVLGILFDGSFRTWETNAFRLDSNWEPVDGRSGQYPEHPTSFGWVGDAPFVELVGRQNSDPESMAYCCPVPLFAIGPAAVTPVPEPATWLLIGTGLVGVALRRHARRK